MTACFLGIDVGLSGARAVVISASGKMLAHARLESATSTMPPKRLAGLVDRTVRLALDGRPLLPISAIAVAAFGPAPILLDRRGHVLAQLRLFEELDGFAGKPAEDDLECRLREFRRLSPMPYREACRICDVTGYLVARFTGQLTMDHATAADYARLSLPGRIALPRVASGDEQAGFLTAAAARRLGLPAGIPVAVGTYDSTADLVAAGFGNKGREAVIILGSTLVLGVLTAAPLRSRHLRSMPHVGPGWFSGGWTNAAGASLALADTILAPRGGSTSAAAPLVWPYFAGERAPVWAPHATGMIAGLRSDTTAAALRQGFVQGVALSAADIADRLAVKTGKAAHWTVTGGGSRDGDLMSELTDALGAPLDVVSGAADHLGPAILAARSAGIDIRLPVGRRYRPRRGAHRAYGERLLVYRQVFEAVRPLLAGIRKVTKSRSQTT